MSERPTLTIRATCPTCGGGGGDWSEDGKLPLTYGVECESCKGDGTIRQAVSCQSCHWWVEEGYGDRRCLHLVWNTLADFGCLAWQAREGA